jgi:hypothetical protein
VFNGGSRIAGIVPATATMPSIHRAFGGVGAMM